MRAYLAVYGARFRTLLQYRAAALAGLGTQVFWGWLQLMVFSAFFASSSEPQPMRLEQVITYIWLKQGLLLLLPWRPDTEVQAMVKSGHVAYEFLRPVDLYWLWYARALALRTAPVMLRCIPMVVMAYLFFGLQPPAGWGAAASFAVSLVAAVLLSTAMTALLSVATLWTIEGRGVQGFTTSIVNLFSGSLIPLAFFPGWFQPLSDVLPFRGLMDTPFRLYMGHLPAGEVWTALAHQLIWIGLIIVAGRWLLQQALRRVEVQGG